MQKKIPIGVGGLGPKNNNEARIFAEEKFRVGVQFMIQSTMRKKNVSQKELARRLNISEARISRFFSPGCNITVRNLARIFHALGEECTLSCIGTKWPFERGKQLVESITLDKELTRLLLGLPSK